MNRIKFEEIIEEIHHLKNHLDMLEKQIVDIQRVEEENKHLLNEPGIFPERLKALRKQAHITQEQMAKALGVHKDSLSHWENGRRIPSFQTVTRMANIIGVSVSELFKANDENNGSKSK